MPGLRAACRGGTAVLNVFAVDAPPCVSPSRADHAQIFRRHLVCERQGDSLVVLDASGVNGVACFNQWAQTRQGLSEPEKTFQRCALANA